MSDLLRDHEDDGEDDDDEHNQLDHTESDHGVSEQVVLDGRVSGSTDDESSEDGTDALGDTAKTDDSNTGGQGRGTAVSDASERVEETLVDDRKLLVKHVGVAEARGSGGKSTCLQHVHETTSGDGGALVHHDLKHGHFERGW